MTWFASRRGSAPAAGLRLWSCALLLVGLSGAPVLAQPFRTQAVPPSAPSPEARQAFQTKIKEQARLLARDDRLKDLSPHEREAVVEFVAGNMLFAAIHRLGLALLSELRVPTIGGVDEGADVFAVLALLELGKRHFSDRILMEAAKGWLTSLRREQADRDGSPYERVRIERRGHRMVCLMAGADAARFSALPEEAALPKRVQRNCGWDYDRAVRSWDVLLRPHRPGADQPRTRIDVSYAAATGNLAIYAQVFRNLGFLEAIAEVAASQVTWPGPLLLEMRSCGSPTDPTWSTSSRTLSVCYEMAADLAGFYRGVEQRRK